MKASEIRTTDIVDTTYCIFMTGITAFKVYISIEVVESSETFSLAVHLLKSMVRMA